MKLFVALQLIVLYTRRLISPLVYLATLWTPALKKRFDFENLNQKNTHSRSFLLEGVEADVAFEISSEGEWEQMGVFIQDLLRKGKRIEIMISSDSLEFKMTHLYREFPQQMRFLRLPYLSPWMIEEWISAKVLCFCRYDFLPELLALKAHRSIKFILFSATLKNKQDALKGLFGGWYWRELLRLFDFIFCATMSDSHLMASIVGKDKVDFFEFRHQQIIQRQRDSLKALELAGVEREILEKIESFPISSRIVLGSCWPNEMEIFKDQQLCQRIRNGEVLVALAPHKLNDQFLSELKTSLVQNGVDLPVSHLKRGSRGENLQKGSLWLFEYRGILCEMYQYFGTCYVGGGFGRSIHSVLEPFWAGCHILIGPKTHRSTEYDYVLEFAREDIKIVPQLSEISKFLAPHASRVSRAQLAAQVEKQSERTLRWLMHFLEEHC